MSQQGYAPRRAAVYLLDQVIGEGRLMAELVGGGDLNHLSAGDRARAQRLASDVLRGLDRADRVLKPFLARDPGLTAKNILRLGVIELLLNQEASHGVVNSLVEVAGKGKKTHKLKGLVNAILRKVDQAGIEAWNKQPIPKMPNWLRGPLVQAYSRPVIEQIEAAHFVGAPLDVTAKNDPTKVAEQISGTVLSSGSVRLAEYGQVSTMDGFTDGDWWIQDAAAALPVKILSPQRGEKILDVCAAPGGKTMQLAAAGSDVTALDISKHRLARVSENLERVGLKAKTVAGDALEYFQAGWDAVLLDAPCSATGTMRRHSDLAYAKDGSEFGALIELQEQMLNHVWSLLKPGGRLVYCTCSLLPDEGECQIEEFLDRTKDATIDAEALKVSGVEHDWTTEEGGLRLRPDYWADHGGMDGFYIAMVRKAV